jgi:hypothetical protein
MAGQEGPGSTYNGRDVGHAIIAEARDTLARALAKINHCLDQLSDADVAARPAAGMNSIAIIANHLAGNLQQWICAGLGNEPDTRYRPGEFDEPTHATIAAVRRTLSDAVTAANRVLARIDPADLLRVRKVQGFDVTGTHALFDTTAHFVGHTHQIVQLTRLRRGLQYRFQFVPQTVEQGAPPEPARTTN